MLLKTGPVSKSSFFELSLLWKRERQKMRERERVSPHFLFALNPKFGCLVSPVHLNFFSSLPICKPSVFTLNLLIFCSCGIFLSSEDQKRWCVLHKKSTFQHSFHFEFMQSMGQCREQLSLTFFLSLSLCIFFSHSPNYLFSLYQSHAMDNQFRDLSLVVSWSVLLNNHILQLVIQLFSLADIFESEQSSNEARCFLDLCILWCHRICLLLLQSTWNEREIVGRHFSFVR